MTYSHVLHPDVLCTRAYEPCVPALPLLRLSPAAMEGVPLVFAAGAAPPLDLSLDEIIKQRKKDDKKAKPGAAKATPGKKGKPQVVRACWTRPVPRATRRALRIALACCACSACVLSYAENAFRTPPRAPCGTARAADPARRFRPARRPSSSRAWP